MADRKSLGIIGFILSLVTAAVMLVGVVVVRSHVDGQLELDDARVLVSASLAPVVR